MTQMAVTRHNEYNNNDEDYTKAKKSEVVQKILHKRKGHSRGSPAKEAKSLAE